MQPPQLEPLTLVEAKNHLNEIDTEHDASIDILIKAARVAAEDYTGRACITQTLQITRDQFDSVIELPRPPLQSAESITYVDLGGVVRTLDTNIYLVDNRSTPGRVTLADGQVWPDVLQVSSAVVIEFIAGYGDGVDDVPESIRQAMRLYLTKYYDLDARVGDYLDQAIKVSLNPERIYGM